MNRYPYSVIDKNFDGNSLYRILMTLTGVIIAFVAFFSLLWVSTHSDKDNKLTLAILFLPMITILVPIVILKCFKGPQDITIFFNKNHEDLKIIFKDGRQVEFKNTDLILVKDDELNFVIQTTDKLQLKIPKILYFQNIRTSLHFIDHVGIFDLVLKNNRRYTLRSSFSNGKIKLNSQHFKTSEIRSQTSRYF